MVQSKYHAFVSAVDTGSFTRAAEKLGYTQSGISHLIASLEEELDLSLLIRGKSGIRLTPEGESLLPYFRNMIETENAISFTSAKLHGLSAGSLRIGTFSSAAVHLLPPLLRNFSKQYPGIDLQILCGTYATVEAWLLENAVDAAFVPVPSLPEFKVHPLAHDRMMAIVPDTESLSGKEEIEIRELASFPFIVPAEGTKYHLGKLFREAGIKPMTRFEMDDDFAALAMVSCGFGVTILPELILKDYPLKHVSVIPIKNAFRDIGFALNQTRPVSPAVSAFLKLLQ